MHNGVIYNDSSVRIADVVDGTSNTFIFGEHSHGYLLQYDPNYGVSDNSWNSGRWYDTQFATYYPLNTKRERPGRQGPACRATPKLLVSDRRHKPPPERREFRFLRRLGPLPQGHDLHLVVQLGRIEQPRLPADGRFVEQLRLHHHRERPVGGLPETLHPRLRRDHQRLGLLIRPPGAST